MMQAEIRLTSLPDHRYVGGLALLEINIYYISWVNLIKKKKKKKEKEKEKSKNTKTRS